MNIDFNENPVTEVAGYKERMFEMFPELIVSKLTNYTY